MYRPVNLMSWVKGNTREIVYNDRYKYFHRGNLSLMIASGPPLAPLFHVSSTEEILYQVRGDLRIQVFDGEIVNELNILEGQIYVIPDRVAHLPIRDKGSIGLILEGNVNIAPGYYFGLCSFCGLQVSEKSVFSYQWKADYSSYLLSCKECKMLEVY